MYICQRNQGAFQKEERMGVEGPYFSSKEAKNIFEINANKISQKRYAMFPCLQT